MKNNSSILTAVFLISLFGIGFFYYEHQKALEIQKQEDILRIKEEQKIKLVQQNIEIQALFDVYLQQFITDLKQNVKRYKETRQVLQELTQPYNFETPEYARENYMLFTKNVAPTLRQTSDDVIGTFSYYQNLIEKDLQGKDSTIQQNFSKEWKAMSAEQAADYVDFFTSQEDLLRAYEKLIEFYYVHSQLYDVDVETNIFSFKREQDAQQYQKLLKAVEALRKK